MELAAFLMTTADGYHQGAGGAFDFWNVGNAEFEEFSDSQLEQADTIVFGRRTFEGMASFWPSQDARDASPRTAMLMNRTPKIVVSRTLTQTEWQPTEIVQDIAELAGRPGRSLVLGSSMLVASLADAGLLDELRLMINPVVLGQGSPVLAGLGTRRPLELAGVDRFESGNILLTYRLPGVRPGAEDALGKTG